MRYVSTRGAAPELGFADVVLEGLATDGGLYVPTEYPSMPSLPVGDYAALAHAIITPYVGSEIESSALLAMCRDAYATFRHPATVPLVPPELPVVSRRER